METYRTHQFRHQKISIIAVNKGNLRLDCGLLLSFLKTYRTEVNSFL